MSSPTPEPAASIHGLVEPETRDMNAQLAAAIATIRRCEYQRHISTGEQRRQAHVQLAIAHARLRGLLVEARKL